MHSTRQQPWNGQIYSLPNKNVSTAMREYSIEAQSLYLPLEELRQLVCQGISSVRSSMTEGTGLCVIMVCEE
jgi:hypothetical protein